ncbi:MAG: ABC transporter permease subunit [bacterium]|jgi:branched-chain amino acid transport system permease protein|nr:ABC transporter ATP-binding protein [Betaproteobacteria bacterium]
MPGAAGRSPLAQGVLLALAAAALLLAPFLVDALLGRAWVRVLDLVMLYTMLALGLNIVVGFAGLLDLGYIAFFAVGAYLYALCASPHFGLHLPFWLLLPAAALLAGLFGMLLGAPTLKLRGDYLAIVTLGFGEIIRIFLNNMNAPFNLTNGPQGITMIRPIDLAGVSMAKAHEIGPLSIPSLYNYYYLFLVLTLLVVFVSARLQHSRVGRAWIAIREDEAAARASGVNTRNLKLLAFAMGASFGGIAGSLYASFQGFVSPESFGLMESIMVLCMVVLGGMGHIRGVVLGAALLVTLPEALRYIGPLQRWLFGQVHIEPSDLRLLLFGVALVVVMRWRPAGLWPSAIRRREFAAARAAAGDAATSHRTGASAGRRSAP